MNAKISERYKVNAEVLGVTSAAGTTSLNYDMQGCEQAHIICNLKGNLTSVVVDLMESSGATVAGTSAAGGKVGIVIGGAATAITEAGGVRQVTITHTTGTTSEAMQWGIGSGGMKTFTYTSSTASLNSTAWASTNFYYGSTVESSANTGPQLAIDSLKTAFASTIGFGNIFTFSTPTTSSLVVTLMDNATGSLVFSNTASSVVPTVVPNQAVVGFDVNAEDLTSTLSKRYIGVKCGTAATACDFAVTVIRRMKDNPPAYPGKLSS